MSQNSIETEFANSPTNPRFASHPFVTPSNRRYSSFRWFFDPWFLAFGVCRASEASLEENANASYRNRTTMKPDEMRCPECQEPVEPRWKVCPACGHQFSGAARNLGQAIPSPADPTTFLRACYEQSWAVVIGINDYQKAGRLEFAVPDADGTRNELIRVGFAAERIYHLVDGEATRQSIQDLLSVELAKKTGKNDRLFVFFAGHGQDFKTPSGDTIGYFIPVDGDRERLASRCISMEDINTWSRLIPAKHILYVMDCCYSGLAATRTTGLDPGRRDYLEVVTRQSVRQIITAGRADEKVIERSGQGVFTRVLLRGLQGDADVHGRGFITGLDLGHYLESRVCEESGQRQHPLFRYLSGEGEFVFVLPRATKATPAKPSPIIRSRNGSGDCIRSQGTNCGSGNRIEVAEQSGDGVCGGAGDTGSVLHLGNASSGLRSVRESDAPEVGEAGI